MTPASIRRRVRAEAVWLWSRVLAAAAVTVAGAGLLKMWQLEEARQREVALTAQHEPIQQLRNDLQVLRARIASVHENEQLALNVAETPAVLSVLAGVTESAGEFRGEAYIEELNYSAPDPLTANAKPQSLEIVGMARDPACIQRFLDALKSSGRFHTVRLEDSEAKLLRGTATTAFEIECTL